MTGIEPVVNPPGLPPRPDSAYLALAEALAAALADNFRGTLPDYFREAGFDPVQLKGRRAGILAFWTAIKPEGSES